MLKSYKLLIILSISIVSLCSCLVVINAMADNLEQATSTLKAQTDNLKVSQINSQLSAMDSALQPLGLPMPDKKDARDMVINTAEKLREMYGATVESDLTDKNSMMSMKLTFTVTPNADGQVTALTDFLTSSYSPIITVNRMEFATVSNSRTLAYHVTLIQPYLGGHYVY